MIDFSRAIASLGKIPNVLGIRYSTKKPQMCLIPVLRDTPKVRMRVAKVMARYGIEYRIYLQPGSDDHVCDVERIAEQGRRAEGGRSYCGKASRT